MKEAKEKMIEVGNIKIGTGKPKICVPVTAGDAAGAVREAEYIVNNLRQDVDLVELRIDYLREVKNGEKLCKALHEVKEVLADIPLLCTLRTIGEGGEIAAGDQEYEELLLGCIQSGAIDLIDVEIFKAGRCFEKIAGEAHKNNIYVLASSHDFAKTPAKDEMVSRLMMMERAGADIAKIAVMPGDREDVLALLSASSIAKTCMDIPVVTISMGKLGMISRLSGEVFGSCITFGAGRRASAPGQIAAGKLREILELI